MVQDVMMIKLLTYKYVIKTSNRSMADSHYPYLCFKEPRNLIIKENSLKLNYIYYMQFYGRSKCLSQKSKFSLSSDHSRHEYDLR